MLLSWFEFLLMFSSLGGSTHYLLLHCNKKYLFQELCFLKFEFQNRNFNIQT